LEQFSLEQASLANAKGTSDSGACMKAHCKPTWAHRS